MGEAGQAEEIMYGIEETIARNGSTREDIEGGSFQVVDGIRVPIFSGIAGEQIDSLECPESHAEERRAELRKALDELNN